MDLSLKTLLDELAARVSDGPMQFRFVVQPVMAAILGTRDGFADAKTGTPPFVMALMLRQVDRRTVQHALRRLALPILIASLIDAIIQFVMFQLVRPLTALIVGTVLMGLPYATARGFANRIRSRNAAREQRTDHGAQPVPHNLDPHRK